MEFSDTEQALLKQWQFLERQSKNAALTPHQRADYARQLMELPRYTAALKLTQISDVETLTRKLANRYSSMVDDPSGVNNYAEGALALQQGRRNDSKLWTTSLNKESIFKLDSVKKFMETSKLAKQSLIPPGKENEVLFTREKPKIDGGGDGGAAGHGGGNSGGLTTEEDGRNNVRADAYVPQLPRSNAPQPLFKKSDRPPERKFTFSSSSNNNNSSATGRTENHMEIHDEVQPGWQQGYDKSRDITATSAAQYNRIYPPSHPSPAAARPHTLPGSRGPNYPPSGQPMYRGFEPQKRPYSEVDCTAEDAVVPTVNTFKTAREQLAIDHQKKYGGNRAGGPVSTSAYGTHKKSLGTRRGLNSKFVPPVLHREEEYGDDGGGGALVRRAGPGANRATESTSDEPVDERLKNIEPKMIELITNEIMDHGPAVQWDDIAGLEFAKKTVREIIVLPMLRPDIFTGIRAPPKGLLLFGPPGTGKTLIGKCIASQAKSTFFSISASSLTSKWVGEGEKMVRALFAVSRIHQPAVIFIDEIDSLLSQRSDGEHDASRRIKTEFLVQLDGATTSSDERILVVGATNRPQEIDEAARRRFVKRLYIPLPEAEARQQIVKHLMSQQNHQVTEQQMVEMSHNTAGYSGADMANLCREAALGPIRGLSLTDIERIEASEVRPITYEDFKMALHQVKPSVSQQDLGLYIDWNKKFGSWQIE